MKTLRSILLLIVIFTCTNLLQAEDLNNTLMVQQIKYFKTNIGNQISYPELAKDMMIEGTVATKISVQQDGKIKVNAINGNPLLTKDVKLQLENLTITENSLIAGEEIIMKIKFKIE